MNKVLFSLIGFFAVTSAYAETGYDAIDLLDSWGGGTFSKCGESEKGMDKNMGIGVSAKKTSDHPKEDNIRTAPQPMASEHAYRNGFATTDKVTDFSYQMMIATDVNQNGAYFCPVQVTTDNWLAGTQSSLKYVQLSDDCRWLCKEGYSGVGCRNTVTTFCEVNDFKKANYDGLGISQSGGNIAESIAQFLKKENRYKVCVAKFRKQEHNIVLAVTDWAPGGYGAFVQPMVIRARFHRDGNVYDAWPAVYPVADGEPLLVCVSGYAPNLAKKDCLQVNSDLCDQAKSGCPALANYGYDGTIHTEYMPAGETCPDFRCKDNNQAFASVKDKTCVSCPSSMRVGVSPFDGTCVSCELGTVFNGRATNPKELCKPAIRLTKTDMQYGFGYTKNSRPDVADQCWGLGQIDEYRACVLANVPSATSNPAVPSATKNLRDVKPAPSVSQSASILTFETPSVTPSGNNTGGNSNPGDDADDNTDENSNSGDGGTDGNTGGQQNPAGVVPPWTERPQGPIR